VRLTSRPSAAIVLAAFTPSLALETLAVAVVITTRFPAMVRATIPSALLANVFPSLMLTTIRSMIAREGHAR
jgi:hypothetical protein